MLSWEMLIPIKIVHLSMRTDELQKKVSLVNGKKAKSKIWPGAMYIKKLLPKILLT